MSAHGIILMHGRNVFVTGASGLIGSSLVKLLEAKGAKIHKLEGDIREMEKYAKMLAGCNYVFHLAASINVQNAIENPLEAKSINTDGTLALLEAMRKHAPDAKLAFSSSASVYGRPVYLPIDEKHPLNPIEPYAASKAAAEMFCAAYTNTYGMKYCATRASHAYGPNQSKAQLISKIINKCLAGEKITLTKQKNMRDFIYAKDAAEALMLVAEKGNGIYNISSGEEIGINELIKKIISLTKPGYANVETVDSVRKADIEKIAISSAKAQKELGWKAKYTLDAGLRETVEAFKAQGKTAGGL